MQLRSVLGDSILVPVEPRTSSTAGPRATSNRQQNAVQVFFFVNNFHDHLPAAPIGFTEAAGNFQLVNASGQGFAGTGLTRRTTARTRSARPCGILRVPGREPHRQREHVHASRRLLAADADVPLQRPGHRVPRRRDDPFVQANGGDEADVVYHEYTHGLSNRLVVDADGNSTLGNIQAGSMGEAWSDWYAIDYLVNQGSCHGHAGGRRRARVGDYVGRRRRPDPDRSRSTARSARRDPGCDGDPAGPRARAATRTATSARSSAGPRCTPTARSGARRSGISVTALGSSTTESDRHAGDGARRRRTRRILDMRNSILQADLVDNGGANHDTIWSIVRASRHGLLRRRRRR